MTNVIGGQIFCLFPLCTRNHGVCINYCLYFQIISSPEHEVLRVNYCDHSPSVGIRRPSVCLSVRRPSVRCPFTFSCLHSSIYKYQPFSTKLCQNIYDHKILDEFNYGSNLTRTSGVICP